jgi:hypothetical protein
MEEATMLELFGWEIGLTWGGIALLVAGALIIGVAAQLIGEVRVGYEGVLVFFAALVGGYLGGVALGVATTWGPQMGGLYVLPALLGALLLGVVVDTITRTITGGSFIKAHHPV